MATRLVYRMEDESGYGPFTTTPPGVDWQRYNRDVRQFPSPANDPLLKDIPWWSRTRGWADRIGCCSCDQLKHWFGFAVCETLANYGFSFVTYRVPDEFLIAGELQVVFDRHHAERISRASPVSLWQEGTQLSLAA